MKLNAIALALGLASASAFAGNVITIDPDGLGSDAAIQVSTLGWNNGNSISVDGVNAVNTGGLIQTYGQAGLANFNDASSNVITGTGLNAAYQWTYVFGVQEQAVPTGPTASDFFATNGGDNFFKVYYNAAKTQNNLNGTGFTDGQLILSGTISAYDPTSGFGYSNFAITSPTTPKLDQNGTNNYAGLTTTVGSGSSLFEGIVQIGFIDTNFFKGSISEIIIALDSFNSTPFKHVDPSSCFTDGAGNLIGGAGQNSTGTAPVACTNTIGAVNGVSGPNIMFETRATNDFVTTTVPEPGSMALVGAGLLSALGLSRKRR